MGALVNEAGIVKCPRCHKVVLELLVLNDNGSGQKMCRDCKRKERKRLANIKPLF